MSLCPAEPIVAKRKSRFTGEMKIEITAKSIKKHFLINNSIHEQPCFSMVTVGPLLFSMPEPAACQGH